MPEEENIILEVIVDLISNGGTLEQAYEKASKKLKNRTVTACAYRWRNNLKAKHKNTFELAKAQYEVKQGKYVGNTSEKQNHRKVYNEKNDFDSHDEDIIQEVSKRLNSFQNTYLDLKDTKLKLFTREQEIELLKGCVQDVMESLLENTKKMEKVLNDLDRIGNLYEEQRASIGRQIS